MKKRILNIFFVLILFFINISSIQAGVLNSKTGVKKQADSFQQGADFSVASGSNSLGGIIATVISAFLGVLGVIFLILLVMAGYKYMTASGNEDKIKESIDSIRRSIIGLVIIVSAYAITYFVFDSIDWFGASGGSSYGTEEM